MRTDIENMPKNTPFIVLYGDRKTCDVWVYSHDENNDGSPTGWYIIMSCGDYGFIEDGEDMPDISGWFEIPIENKIPV